MELIKLSDLQEYKSKNLKVLLYGNALVGKTTFAATFPKPLIVSTDDNVKGLAVHNDDAYVMSLKDVMEKQTTSGQKLSQSGWEYFKENIGAFLVADAVETIVIDLIQDVHEMCRQYIFRQLGIMHESEDTRRGRVWNMIESEFFSVIKQLMTCEKNVILITHEKDNEGKIIPDLRNSVVGKVQRYTEITGRLVAQGMPGEEPTRTLFVAPGNGYISGNRLGIKMPIIEPTYEKLKTNIEKGE